MDENETNTVVKKQKEIQKSIKTQKTRKTHCFHGRLLLACGPLPYIQ